MAHDQIQREADDAAAAFWLMLEQYPDPWWLCPYCGNAHKSPSGTGTDVVCCGEKGHCYEQGSEDDPDRKEADETF